MSDALVNGWFAARRARFQDCQFYGGLNHFAAANYRREAWIELQNNLFRRVNNQWYGWVHLTAYDSLFWGGTNNINSGYGSNPTWYFHDNAFHGNGLTADVSHMTRSHNAYLGTGQGTLGGVLTNNMELATFTYSNLAGGLGAFYQLDDRSHQRWQPNARASGTVPLHREAGAQHQGGS